MSGSIVAFRPRTAPGEGEGARSAAPARRRTARLRWSAIVASVMLAVAFGARGWQFGQPTIHVDEQFYLLVGDRMLHGAIPYVDVWDRKPIGLFLIYAAIRLLGGVGIVQYQVVATLFAAATATVIALIATRMASIAAATVAGVLYLLLIGLIGGGGGQAPVFYNLPVAIAALVTLRLTGEPAGPDRVRRLGCVAMALIGVAMQIKYSAVFEGGFLGLMLLHASRQAGGDRRQRALDAALWIGIALLPTACALGAYVAIGHGDAFIYANFVSIFQRSGEPLKLLAHRLGDSWTAFHLPLFGVLLAAWCAPWRSRPLGAATHRFVMLWLAAAFAGYFAFGSYFDHYGLPLLVPVCVALAPLFDERRWRLGLVAAVLLLIAGVVAYKVQIHHQLRDRGGKEETARIVAAIRPRLIGCPFIFRGDSIDYYLTGACLPTRWAFPSHLYLKREAGALGVDQLGELVRVMRARPNVVVDMVSDYDSEMSADAIAYFRATVARAYRPVAVVDTPSGARRVIVYEHVAGR